jgi:hypothetical protein
MLIVFWKLTVLQEKLTENTESIHMVVILPLKDSLPMIKGVTEYNFFRKNKQLLDT